MADPLTPDALEARMRLGGPGRGAESVRRARRDDDALSWPNRPRLPADLEHEGPLDARESLLLRRVGVLSDEAARTDVQLGLEELAARVCTRP
jgi:hypothetical protein